MGDIDASSLTASLRLDDESLDKSPLPRFDKVMSNFGIIIRVQKGSGHEVVVRGELLFHFAQSKSKSVLSSNDAHIREMIDLLLMSHPTQHLVSDPTVTPLQVPHLAFVKVLDLPVETFVSADLHEEGVLCI